MRDNLFILWIMVVLVLTFSQGYALCFQQVTALPEPDTPMVPDDTVGAIYYDDFQRDYPGQWLGDTASFGAENGRLRLVSNARPPASIAISSVRVRNTVWEAGVVAAGAFSASNYIRLYLVATTSLLQEPQRGYYLQIDGEGVNHIYRLWRQNGSTRTIVFESGPMPGLAGTFRARVRVTCSPDGYWQVAVDERGNGSFEALQNRSGETSVPDNTYRSGAYSGYLVSFSPARWRDFTIDYMLIKPLDPSDVGSSDVPQAGDILINEVLSNPKPGGIDFLEIYNYSNKTIDLSEVSIARVTTNGAVGNRQAVSDHTLLIHPNEYKVLMRDPAVVAEHYPNGIAATFIEMASLPDFNNETGGVVVYGRKEAIDSLFYTPAMQSPFMISNSGVSLERQHFSVPTNAADNFHSAAAAVGGATPGYQNSQYVAESNEDRIFLTSKTFSPDNDGFEDRLEINYRLPEGGFMANIDIYTDHGRLVKRLVRNQSMAIEGMITWDGLSDANTRLPIGMYVAVIEVYNAKGIRKVYRNSFVLAARL